MSGPLIPSVRGFKVPKVGEAQASCRDAWLANHRGDGPRSPANLRVAIADGATTASASGLWSQILVSASVTGIAPWSRQIHRLNKIPALRCQWHHLARAVLPRPLSWFTEAALERGAFSTLMKVRTYGNTWEAEGWGDSCLFHLRLGHPVRVLPNLEPEDFDQSPFLLASVPGHDQDLVRKMILGRGTLQRGDVLLLATDALACWLLTTQTWPETLRELKGIRSDETYAAWVDTLRRDRGLKNDDTTLVIVEFQ